MANEQLSNKDSVWVVIAAYNEHSKIRGVIDGVTRAGFQVALVDDGSSDATFDQACLSSAHVLRHPLNLGQGAALQTGISYALRQGAKYIVTFDADGQHRVEDLERLLTPLIKGDADVVLGSRFIAGGSALNIPPARILMLKLATVFTKLTTGLALTDTHNGLRAFTGDAASKIHISQNRMAHASEILSQIATLKLRYQEAPVTVEYSSYSLEKGQKLSNSFNIIWESLTGILKR